MMKVKSMFGHYKFLYGIPIHKVISSVNQISYTHCYKHWHNFCSDRHLFETDMKIHLHEVNKNTVITYGSVCSNSSNVGKNLDALVIKWTIKIIVRVTDNFVTLQNYFYYVDFVTTDATDAVHFAYVRNQITYVILRYNHVKIHVRFESVLTQTLLLLRGPKK